jgi:glycosyltransferase involved in cell wall biosynthesis
VTYSVLLIPPQDYLRHPHPTRLSQIFERIDDNVKVTILNVRIRNSREFKKSRHEVIEVGHATRNMLVSYLLSYVSFHIQLARLIQSRRYDCIVLSHVLSPLVPLLVHGRPLIFDYKDVYSRSASAPFRFPTSFLIYAIARLFEALLFHFDMTVVAPTPSMQNLLRQHFGVKSLLITNGADPEIFHPLSKSAKVDMRMRLGVLPTEFCLCYLGSIENWLDLDTVVSAIAPLQNVKLVLVGGAVRSSGYIQKIMGICNSKGLGNRVINTGFLEQANAARILGASDAAIVPFRTDMELSAVALPDKLFEYLATGLPVISTTLPDVERLFGDYVWFYADANELREVVKKLLSGERLPSKQIKVNGGYSWQRISRSYLELITGLIERNRETSYKRASENSR